VAIMIVALCAGGLVVYVVGSVEALGYASGRTTIDMVDLPFGPSKAEHIDMLRRTAAEAHVSVALVTPRRSGAPNELDAYVLRGDLAPPTFWGDVAERPASAIGDAVIVWTYAVDGPAPGVARFLASLREQGFVFTKATPTPGRTLFEGVGRPSVAGVAAAVVLGVVVALVAESHRRGPRQRLRRLAGWTPAAIALRELLDSVVLVLGAFGTVFGALALFLVTRGAGEAVWSLCWAVSAVAVPLIAAVPVLLHVAFAMRSGRRLDGVDASRWRPVLIGASGVALVAVLVGSVSEAMAGRSTAEHLERSLAAEAEHGDDVVLGVGLSDDHQERVMGAIGTRAIRQGRARMAMTNTIRNALLVIGDGAPGVASTTARRDGVTVLIPQTLARETARIEDEVRADIAEGWEVDDADPPRDPVVRSTVVPSTAPIVEAAARWVDWGYPKGTTWPDAVVVVSDLGTIAPNRIATATRNGEVRFSDRGALERALREDGVIDVVTQINSVGAVVDRRLAAVRTELLVLLGATVTAALASLFAATALVVDHGVRHRAAAALRSRVGRHPAVHHVRFVLGAASVCAVTALVASVGRDPSGVLRAVATAGIAGIATAAVLVIVVVVHEHHGKERS
jgi:hypothetical protein